MNLNESSEICEGKPFCNAVSPSGTSTCYLDAGHDGFHHAPCAEHGDVTCGHEEEWSDHSGPVCRVCGGRVRKTSKQQICFQCSNVSDAADSYCNVCGKYGRYGCICE